MWTRKDLKEKAKAAFKANYWSCVIVALILSLFIGGTVSIGNGIGRSTELPQTNEQLTVRDDGILNINGIDFDVRSIDGAGITRMLETVSEGLEKGLLNINGESVDVTDTEKVKEVQKAIEDLQNADLSQYSHDDLVNVLIAILAAVGSVLLIFAAIGCLIKIFLFNPLVVGCQGFFMVNSREKASLGEIKRGFAPSWIHNVGAMLLKDIFVFLWSLLFIIPGIIKSLAYAMVPYILADDPSLSAREAITLSRKMMDGNKWRLFVLDLSFLGWNILSACTFGILGVFYVNPYIYGTHAELYNTLKSKIEK